MSYSLTFYMPAEAHSLNGAPAAPTFADGRRHLLSLDGFRAQLGQLLSIENHFALFVKSSGACAQCTGVVTSQSGMTHT